MQGKPLNSHETDITKPLVVLFIVLAAILVANILGNFSSTSSSTSTRAADTMNESCSGSKPFDYSPYRAFRATVMDLSDNDYCASATKGCVSGYAMDLTASKWGKKGVIGLVTKCIYNCCRKESEAVVLGGQLCREKTGDQLATCSWGKSGCTTEGKEGTDIKCGYVSGGNLLTGNCCKTKGTATTTTSTTTNGTLAGNVTAGKTATDCGVNHLNCTAIFGDGTVGNSYVAGSAIGAVSGRTNIDPDGSTVYSGICAVPSAYATSSDAVKEQNLTCFVNIKTKTQCAKGIYSYYQSPTNNAFTCYISVAGAAESVAVTDGSQADHTCKVSVRGLAGSQSCKDIADQQ